VRRRYDDATRVLLPRASIWVFYNDLLSQSPIRNRKLSPLTSTQEPVYVLLWCEDVEQSVLMGLPEGGLAYLRHKNLLQINNGNRTLDETLRKKTHYEDESRLMWAFITFGLTPRRVPPMTPSAL
jgi:hypothetical protein